MVNLVTALVSQIKINFLDPLSSEGNYTSNFMIPNLKIRIVN